MHRALLIAIVLLATAAPATSAAGDTLAVAVTQPTSGTTVRGTAWAVVWINGARGAANNVTLTIGRRTVGSATTAGAGPILLPYDTRLSADGVQMLTASVRDATGNTGTWSVSINVVNGATPPSPAPASTPAAASPAAATRRNVAGHTGAAAIDGSVRN